MLIRLPLCQKNFTKTIMNRSRLRNIFLKYWTDTNKKNPSTQRNLCKNLLKNTKKSYFENLYTKKNTDNRSFCGNVPPCFTQNSWKCEKSNLIDDSETISSKRGTLTFNRFFSNGVPTLLNIPKLKSFPMARDNLDLIMSVIKSFGKHPKSRVSFNFHFRKTSCNEVEKIISNSPH